MRIAICDDDTIVCRMLSEMIARFSAETGIETQTYCFNAAIDVYNTLKVDNDFDIVFLDICMPELNGIQAGRMIREILDVVHLDIVFVSSDSDYAIQLFDVQPIGFLIKPIRYEALCDICNKIVHKRNKTRHVIEVPIEDGVATLDAQDIVLFEASNKKVRVLVKDGTSYEFRESIKNLEKNLETVGFFRPHNAFLVNRDCVKTWETSRLVLNDGTEVPVAQTRRAEVRRIRNEFVSENRG